MFSPFYISFIVMSYVLTYFGVKFFLNFPSKYLPTDVPGNRSCHKDVIPTAGGVTLVFPMVALFGLSFFLFDDPSWLLLLSFLMAGIGFLDDKHDIDFRIRLFIQFFVALFLFALGYRIDNLYGLFGVYEIGIALSCLLTTMFIVLIINAVNFIDGINGLLSVYALVCFTYFAILFFSYGYVKGFLISISLIGSLIGFLRFNLFNAKIFLGDTGSLFIGLLIAGFFIEAIQFNDFSFKASAIGCIILPCFDLFRLVIIRLYNRKSPFTASRDHLHHEFLVVKKDHWRVTLIYFISILFYICLGIVLSSLLNLTESVVILLASIALVYVYRELLIVRTVVKRLEHLQDDIAIAVKSNILLRKK